LKNIIFLKVKKPPKRFACMNLKKIAIWKQKTNMLPPTTPDYLPCGTGFSKIFTLIANPFPCLAA